MSNVFSVFNQFLSWLSSYTDFLTGIPVIKYLLILVVVLPTLILLIRRHIL